MKVKISVALLIAAVFSSCEAPVEKNYATVNQINGLYVFVYSKPSAPYKELGTVSNDYLNQMKDATSSKKVGKKILGALSTTAQNIDFKSKLDIMIQLAKESYPDANAIIFETGVDQAKVIQFD